MREGHCRQDESIRDGYSRQVVCGDAGNSLSRQEAHRDRRGPAFSIVPDLGRSIRELAHNDLQSYLHHLLRLSRRCRRSRFGNEVNDNFLRDYVARVQPLTNTVALAEPGQLLVTQGFRDNLTDGLDATVHDLGFMRSPRFDASVRGFAITPPEAPSALLPTSRLRPAIAVLPFDLQEADESPSTRASC